MREQRKRLDLRASRVSAALERLPIHTRSWGENDGKLD
jgi:hypothetical protein